MKTTYLLRQTSGWVSWTLRSENVFGGSQEISMFDDNKLLQASRLYTRSKGCMMGLNKQKSDHSCESCAWKRLVSVRSSSEEILAGASGYRIDRDRCFAANHARLSLVLPIIIFQKWRKWHNWAESSPTLRSRPCWSWRKRMLWSPHHNHRSSYELVTNSRTSELSCMQTLLMI